VLVYACRFADWAALGLRVAERFRSGRFLVRELSIFAVIAINLFITVRYCWLIWKQKIKPSLAMWVFFTIAVVGALVTYLSEGNYRLLDNILGSTDVVLVVSVSVAIALYGDRSTKFNKFDRGCLIAVLVIVAFWVFTQNHMVANISIQTIMVIAYFPVVKRLWRSNENTESFAAWIGMLLAPAVSLLSSKGILATIYSLRAMLSVLVLLSLMIRAELRGRAIRRARSGAVEL
jgi:hypothetical protein